MIKIENIEVHYGDFLALKGIDLQINSGEFFTFLGPSGCGKTTLLRTIAGFIQPTKGKVIVDNQDITQLAVGDRSIGMVFQNYALFPTMNVYDNIAFGLKVKKFSKENIEQAVLSIAQKVDLDKMQLFKKVSELSGGQQQRVAIARALIMQPTIACLDEPLSNLDAKLRIQLRNELKELQKKFGITTIYVTHDQEEALTLSDRIAIFNRGKIEQIGTPEEIYNHSASAFVCTFIGDINVISPSLLALFNEQLDKPLDVTKRSYIRLEKVQIDVEKMSDDAQSVCLNAMIEEAEYYGMYMKYRLSIGDHHIKCVQQDDGVHKHLIGDYVKVTLERKYILQYEE